MNRLILLAIMLVFTQASIANSQSLEKANKSIYSKVKKEANQDRIRKRIESTPDIQNRVIDAPQKIEEVTRPARTGNLAREIATKATEEPMKIGVMETPKMVAPIDNPISIGGIGNIGETEEISAPVVINKAPAPIREIGVMNEPRIVDSPREIRRMPARPKQMDVEQDSYFRRDEPQRMPEPQRAEEAMRRAEHPQRMPEPQRRQEYQQEYEQQRMSEPQRRPQHSYQPREYERLEKAEVAPRAQKMEKADKLDKLERRGDY